MNKNWIFLFSAILFLTAKLYTAAQDTGYGGTWEAEYNAKSKTLQMQFYRKSNTNGFRVSIEALRGLTVEMILANSRSVTFQLIREAGTFHCTGSFRKGEGRGEFEFQPDQSFQGKMAQLGYSGISAKKHYELAMLDVNTSFVRDLRDAGYKQLDLENVIEMKIHGASAEYAKSLRDLGYKDISADKLVEMRIHGVSADYVRKMNEAGYTNIPIHKLVEFKIHGVTPEKVAEFRKLGYDTLTPSKLVEFQIHGVTPEFVREIQQLGYSEVAPKDLVSMRIHGVSPIIHPPRSRKSQNDSGCG